MLNAVENINWEALRKQKTSLVEVINDDKLTKHQKDDLDGILHLIDGIQDDATMVFTEETIFGESCECGEYKRHFMHNCPKSNDMPEIEGCPECDDNCPNCR